MGEMEENYQEKKDKGNHYSEKFQALQQVNNEVDISDEETAIDYTNTGIFLV